MSLISVLLFTGGDILAQSDRAAITGSVRDSSGAVVPGAHVTAINAGDNIPVNATTNAMGVYTLRPVPIFFVVASVAFNRHGFNGPNTQIGTADFGKVLPEDLNGLPGPRVGQFGAGFSF